METLKTENIITTLLWMGFEQVDPVLYTMTIGKLAKDHKEFEVEDAEFSSTFQFFTETDGISFRLKQGYTFDSNVSPVEGEYWPLKRALRPNEKLVETLSEEELKQIIIRKIMAIGPDKVDKMGELFSEKEKELIKETFQIDSKEKTPSKSPKK